MGFLWFISLESALTFQSTKYIIGKRSEGLPEKSVLKLTNSRFVSSIWYTKTVLNIHVCHRSCLIKGCGTKLEPISSEASLNIYPTLEEKLFETRSSRRSHGVLLDSTFGWPIFGILHEAKRQWHSWNLSRFRMWQSFKGIAYLGSKIENTGKNCRRRTCKI